MNNIDLKNLSAQPAQLDDCSRLVEVVQRAYRGGLAEVGWKNEHHLVTGPRIDQIKMSTLLEASDKAVLKVVVDNVIAACVLAEKHGNAVHIGMLAVDPDYQNLKIGQVLVRSAEDFARQNFGCNVAKMFVLAQRAELLAWYARLGYEPTGEKEDFPSDAEGSQPVEADTYLQVIEKKI
jgi:ribosomal protein S18 acetylase RimI-like enzyme